jgi:hypothetical protein
MQNNDLSGQLLALEVLLSKCVAKHLHDYSQEEEKDLATRRLLEAVIHAASDQTPEAQTSAVDTARRILGKGRSDSSVVVS